MGSVWVRRSGVGRKEVSGGGVEEWGGERGKGKENDSGLVREVVLGSGDALFRIGKQ